MLDEAYALSRSAADVAKNGGHHAPPLSWDAEDARLLKYLTTSDEMSPAWRDMEAEAMQRSFDRRSVTRQLLQTCSRSHSGFRARTVRSPSDHEEHYVAISNLVGGLKKKLRADPDLRSFHHPMQASCFSGSRLFDAFETLYKRESGAMPSPLYAGAAFDAAWAVSPTVEQILDEIENRATKLAKAGPLVKKSKSRSRAAPIAFFEQQLAADLKFFYGKPMRAVLASFTDAYQTFLSDSANTNY